MSFINCSNVDLTVSIIFLLSAVLMHVLRNQPCQLLFKNELVNSIE